MNDGDQALNFLYLVGVLILVGSSFAVRRIPIAQGLKMLIGWVLIFGIAFIVFTLKDEFMALGNRMLVETRGGVEETAPGEVRIRQAAGRPFLGDAEVNGQSVRFLVDSGATTTSLSRETAAAGRRSIPASGFRAMVQTANGVVMVDRGRADTIAVGSIARRDVAVHISDAFGDLNVIGMNFLSTLSALERRGEDSGVAVVTMNNHFRERKPPRHRVCILHNVYYRTFRCHAMKPPRHPLPSPNLPKSWRGCAIRRHGCEWDRDQTFETIAPYTIEEAYEVDDAIRRGDMEALKDELGDLQLQVVFHARMAEERGAFDLDDVIGVDLRQDDHAAIRTSSATPPDSPGWETLKAAEREAHADESALAGVALALPALKRAEKIQRRAARIGFDWPDAEGPRLKIDEELGEIERAESDEERAAEIGDLLFAVVNFARHLDVEPGNGAARSDRALRNDASARWKNWPTSP